MSARAEEQIVGLAPPIERELIALTVTSDGYPAARRAASHGLPPYRTVLLCVELRTFLI